MKSLLLTLTLVCTLGTPHSQAEPLLLERPVDVEAFNREIYSRRAVHQTIGKKDYITPAIAAHIVGTYKRDPNYPMYRLQRELNSVRSRLEESTRVANDPSNYQSVPEGVVAFYSELMDVVGSVSPKGQLPAEVLKFGVTNGIRAFDYLRGPYEQIAEQNAIGSQLPSILYQSHTFFSELRTMAKTNPSVRELAANLIAREIGATTDEPGFDILARDPLLANSVALQDLKNRIERGGLLNEDDRTLIRNEFQTIIDQAESSFQASQATIKAELEAKLNSNETLVKELVTEQRKLQDEKARLEKFEAMQAGVNTLALMALLGGDQKLSHQISVVGSAAISIGNSVEKLADGGLTTFGTLASVGTIVGALSSIVNLFFGGPAIETIILEEIRELKKMVAELRDAMHERFDQIDRKLDTIYLSLLVQTDKVLTTQALTRAEIQVIQTDLLNLRSQLSGIDTRLSTLLFHLYDRDIAAMLSECSDGVDASRFKDSDYEKCLDKFAACASDSLPRELLPTSLLVNSNTRRTLPSELNARMTFLLATGMLEEAGFYAKSSTALDFHRWTECTLNYITIATLWENFYKFASPNKTQQLINNTETGILLPGNTMQKPEFLTTIYDHLFSTKVEGKKERASLHQSFINAIGTAETHFEAEQLATYDLEKGLDQKPQYKATIFQGDIPPCKGFKYKNSTEHKKVNFVLGGLGAQESLILDKRIVMAAALLPELTPHACWSNANWVNEKYESKDAGFDRSPMPGTPGTKIKTVTATGNAMVEISFYLGEHLVQRRRATDNNSIAFQEYANIPDKNPVTAHPPKNLKFLYEEAPRLWNNGEKSLRAALFKEKQGRDLELAREGDKPTGIEVIESLLQDRFAKARLSFRKELQVAVGGTGHGEVRQALEDLDLSKRILDTVFSTSLGIAWPGTELHSMLHGDKGLFDSWVFGRYLADLESRNMPITVDAIVQELNQRNQRFVKLLAQRRPIIDRPEIRQIKETLKLIKKGQEHLRPQDSIETVIMELQDTIDRILAN